MVSGAKWHQPQRRCCQRSYTPFGGCLWDLWGFLFFFVGVFFSEVNSFLLVSSPVTIVLKRMKGQKEEKLVLPAHN